MLEDFKFAFKRPNSAHVQLIIINVVAFLVFILLKAILSKIYDDAFFYQVIYKQISLPALLTDFIQKPWTIITYAFAHDLNSILHVLFNMLVFYYFGKLFVEYLGSDKLVAVYVLGFLAGGVAYLLMYNIIPYFKELAPNTVLIGASAAVFAVLAAASTLLPNYSFYLLFLGPVKIKYLAMFYIGLSLLGVIGNNNAGGEMAHLGGALIGFVYVKQLQAGSNWGNWIVVFLDWVKDIFKPSPKVRVSYRNEKSKVRSSKEKSSAFQKAKDSGKVSQDEIDAILDKISEGGYESLTREEKEKLFNASKKH